MTVTETYKKALVCFEDFIPDFCEKLAQDRVIDSDYTAAISSELYATMVEFLNDYCEFDNDPVTVTTVPG